MSIDDVIKKESKIDRIKHYAKYSFYSASHALLKNMLICTERRYYRELPHRSASSRNATLLEDVIYTTTHSTITPMSIIYALIEPRFLGVMAATNIASLAYEVHRTRKARKQENRYDKPLTINDHSVMKREYLWDIPDEELDGLVEKENQDHARGYLKKKADAVVESAKDRLNYLISPGRWWNSAKRFGRKLAVHACSYALVGSMAFGHLMLTRNNDPVVSPRLVNFEVESCTLDSNKFYLLEEMHYYNASSSEYMRRFIDYSDITVLLSEGVGYSGPESGIEAEIPAPVKDAKDELLRVRNKKTPNISETLLFVGLTPFILGAGCYKDGPSDICASEGIPIVYLESVRKVVPTTDENSEVREPESGGKGIVQKVEAAEEKKEDAKYIRKGLSETENTVLGVIGGAALVMAPYLYTFGIPLRYGKFPKVLKRLDQPIGLLMPGLLHERNRNMVEASADYILSHPQDTAMVRIGAMHAEGMKEIYAEKGEIDCVPFDVTTLEEPE
ncbi:MAG: hypothetical protein ABIA62_07710 [Candidatus Woesearchaeota archaeon]